MSSNVQPFIDYLQQLQRKGQTHVHLDESAREVLREFYLVAKGNKKPTSESVVNSPSLTIEIEIQGTTSQEKINSLALQAETWQAAKDLGTLKDKLVFSSGNTDSDIMFISDAPGYFEESKGQPFAGPAGEKLDGILKAMGINRSDVYITHLVKFRPSMPNQTTANRKPSTEELDAFNPFIEAEIKIVNPKVIVALGSVVAQHLLNTTTNIDMLRGKFHHSQGTQVPVLVTYHPSYLLQNEATADKRKLWEDMLAVMEKLEMPISEKQQQFFLPKA
jgi:uracil-DNA glycosylase